MRHDFLPRPWAAGDYLTHRFNPELGIGRILSVEARALHVEFSRSRTRLRIGADDDALVPVTFAPGRRVRVTGTGTETTVDVQQADGRVALGNGQVVSPGEIWPLDLEGALAERLELGDLDEVHDWALRLRVLQLRALREADGLGTFLGGRVRLFPHQLHVAERATAANPVRWLLADEVGLGKTIEACLILNRLIHTGRVERCLIVAPASLTVQWLGELWRKYHQVFTLLDAERLDDVARDFGPDFNPFDVHRRAIVALELLVDRPRLTELATRAGIDLVVVDEAQRLVVRDEAQRLVVRDEAQRLVVGDEAQRAGEGHAAWRAVAPLAAAGGHVLLLSATPLAADARGFFRLLQLLRPDEFPGPADVTARLMSGAALPPCTSATRRVDIGGLPPRVPAPVDLPAGRGWARQYEVERALRSLAAGSLARGEPNTDLVRRALASGAALCAGLRPGPAGSATSPELDRIRMDAEAMDAGDPRVEWLAAHARRWREAGDKTLVFVHHRETLEMLRVALSRRAQLATGMFHEALSPAGRDMEVARFREPSGPSLLVSTEAGGEGRNFEFCRRLVLYDLPWSPSVVEQRIGRLDRIGRRLPVEIVYFRPPEGLGRDVVRLFESLGLFREPLAAQARHVSRVEDAIARWAGEAVRSRGDEDINALVRGDGDGDTVMQEAADHALRAERYSPTLAPALLARVPAQLDSLNESVVVRACERLGFTVERQRGERAWSIELGSGALIESLPGVGAGMTYVGTFDREEAVAREHLDFFASGHPLVEGLFAHLEESPLGRVARFAIEEGGTAGQGVVALYKTPDGFDVTALDSHGDVREDWAAALRRPGVKLRRLAPQPAAEARWRGLVRRLTARLDPARPPDALAAVVVR